MKEKENKFYPEAENWMWTYCEFLGKFTDSKGRNYDLGIYVGEKPYISAAIVWGNTPGDYSSGDLHRYSGHSGTNFVKFEHYTETINRAKKAGFRIL